MKRLGVVIIFVVLIALAGRVCGVNLADLTAGVGKGVSLLTLFFPPAWSDVPTLLQPILATMILAISATVLGTLFSFPCALAASSTSRRVVAANHALPDRI